MGIIAWIVLGLIAGAIAKALMPGPDPGGIIVTALIGIVGAFLGGFLGNLITGSGLNGFSLWSIILAIVGSMILLWIYRVTNRHRGTPTTKL
jgi:uncharacterized membrane protein YeaQ/YmgE (transglycosylase-associated protein family)